jgi:tRNA(adenine34) deaminase
LEPCTMCAGALVLARLPELVYGAADPKAGAVGSLYDVAREARLNHRVEVVSGVMAGECGALLKTFFRARREPSAGARRAVASAAAAPPGAGTLPAADGGVA